MNVSKKNRLVMVMVMDVVMVMVMVMVMDVVMVMVMDVVMVMVMVMGELWFTDYGLWLRFIDQQLDNLTSLWVHNLKKKEYNVNKLLKVKNKELGFMVMVMEQG